MAALRVLAPGHWPPALSKFAFTLQSSNQSVFQAWLARNRGLYEALGCRWTGDLGEAHPLKYGGCVSFPNELSENAI
jgi:hypothetical protein